MSQVTLATRYTVTRDPESEYPELVGIQGSIISEDPSEESYELCVWGDGGSVEQALNSASSVTGFEEVGKIEADLEEIADAISEEDYRAWISANRSGDGSRVLTPLAMAGDLCEEYVLNLIEGAEGAVDITADVVGDLEHSEASETTDASADVRTVEYYDQLPASERPEYRNATDFQLSSATLAELDRIDAGLKALCLS